MATQKEWWSADLAAASAPTLKERAAEADIGQSGASAAASAATAREKTATLPSTVRKEAAAATKAEIEAEQSKMALDKARRMLSGLPPVEGIKSAQELVLTELRNLVKAKELSKTMFGASGIGHSLTAVPMLSGTPANTMRGLLAPVQANTAFSELNRMRQESPTGAALGNVTEKELDLLKSREGLIDPTADDETFQQGVDNVIARRIRVLNSLNADPAVVAEILGADNIEKFAPMIQAYRYRKEDEEALANYVKTSKAKGSFDPADYAALSAQAYYNATGNTPDDTYVNNALATGRMIGESKGATVAPLDYNKADEDARNFAVTRVKGAAPEGLTWSQTLGGAAINLIPSAFELATDTVKALTVDLPDTIEGVAKVVAGATGLSDDDEAWNAVKDYYVDRYGSMEGFKRALREDPASILADVAGIATGGATIAAKAAGTAGRVSRIAMLSNAAKKAEGFADAVSFLDPLVIAGKTAKTGAKATGKLAETVGVSTPARLAGVTTADVKQAVQAGREGSPEFVAQMTETGSMADPIAKAQQAVTELYQQRSKDYTRRMNRLKQSEEVVAFDDVEKAIEDVRGVGRHKGVDISSAADVWDQVDSKYMEFFEKGLNSIEDFDAMKRSIANIRDTYQRGTPQYKVANDVVKAINNTIVQKAPVYANIMNDYRVASDVLSDLTASLSTGAASSDTTLNKLRRVASGKGARGRTVLDLLEATPSGKGIGNMLAGQAMSGREPAGLTPTLSTGSALLTGSPEPLLAGLISPRALGEKAYGLGQVIGGVERAAGSFGELVGAPTVADTAARLYDRYGVGTARGIRVANPALIQPQVNDYEYAPPSEEETRAALAARYLPSFPTTRVTEDTPLSLESLRTKYEGPVLPSLKPKKKKDEEEEDTTSTTGFARGGAVYAPSMY